MRLGGSTATKSRPKTKAKSSSSKGKKTKGTKNKLSSSSKYGTDKDVKSKATVGRGWGDADKMRKQTGGFVPSVTLTKEDTLFKFLTDDPSAVYVEHWVHRSAGKRSWVCMKSVTNPKTGKAFTSCPLCDLGTEGQRRTKMLFNVIVLSDEEGPTPMVLEAGPRLQDALRVIADDKRKGPLTRHYLAIKAVVPKGKEKTQTQYPISIVKERDLEDDYDIKPLSESKLQKFMDKQPPQEKLVAIPSMTRMKELVKQLAGEDEDDDSDDDED